MVDESGECDRQRRFIAQVIASTAINKEQLLDYLNTETEKLANVPDISIKSAMCAVWGELSRDERFVLDQRYRVLNNYGPYVKSYIEIGKAFPHKINPAKVKKIKKQAMAKLHPILIDIVRSFQE